MKQQAETLQKNRHIQQNYPKQNYSQQINKINNNTIYPLKTHWRFYCFKRGKQSQELEYSKKIQSPYKQQQQTSALITTLQQFLQYHHALRKPSQIPVNNKVMFFKEGCPPLWQKWQNSGCFLFQQHTKNDILMKQFDDIWQKILFSSIGEDLTYESNAQIIGISLCKREKITILQIWLRSQHNAEIILQGILRVTGGKADKFKFKRHSQSIKCNSTIKGSKKIYTIS